MNGKYVTKVDDCKDELKKIKSWIDNHKLDSNVRYLVNYAVIKSCGTIEDIFKEMVFDYLVIGANSETTCFLTKNIINSSSNPKTGQIQKMLQQINGQWANEFDGKIIGSNQKVQLNSLVELRNTFSHGGNITSSIDEIILFFDSGRWVLEKLHECIYST